MLCGKHRIWLGSRGRSHLDTQYDVDGLTGILHAQRRHHRLAHRTGPTIAALAFTEATAITDTRARRGRHRDRRDPLIRALRRQLPLTGKLHNGDPLTAVVTYPETVDLAQVLADFRWRYPRPGRASAAIGEFTRAVNHTLGIHYRHSAEGYDGLYPGCESATPSSIHTNSTCWTNCYSRTLTLRSIHKPTIDYAGKSRRHSSVNYDDDPQVRDPLASAKSDVVYVHVSPSGRAR